MFKIIKWLLYYIVVQFLLLFLMVGYYTFKGINSLDIPIFINDNKIYLVLFLGVIFIPILYYNYKKLNIKKCKLNNISSLIILGISLSLLYNVLGFYLDKILDSNLYGIFDIKSALISNVLIGPVIEEYLFRGIIYNESKRVYSLKKSVFLTTFLFGISHTTIIQIIYALIIGFILIKVYEKYKNINSCIIVHLFSNLTTTFLTLLLIKDIFLINLFIFIIGLILLVFIKNKKYDII